MTLHSHPSHPSHNQHPHPAQAPGPRRVPIISRCTCADAAHHPARRAEPEPAPSEHDENAPFPLPMRGVLFGLLLSMPLWGVIITAALYLVR